MRKTKESSTTVAVLTKVMAVLVILAVAVSGSNMTTITNSTIITSSNTSTSTNTTTITETNTTTTTNVSTSTNVSSSTNQSSSTNVTSSTNMTSSNSTSSNSTGTNTTAGNSTKENEIWSFSYPDGCADTTCDYIIKLSMDFTMRSMKVTIKSKQSIGKVAGCGFSKSLDGDLDFVIGGESGGSAFVWNLYRSSGSTSFIKDTKQSITTFSFSYSSGFALFEFTRKEDTTNVQDCPLSEIRYVHLLIQGGDSTPTNVLTPTMDPVKKPDTDFDKAPLTEAYTFGFPWKCLEKGKCHYKVRIEVFRSQNYYSVNIESKMKNKKRLTGFGLRCKSSTPQNEPVRYKLFGYDNSDKPRSLCSNRKGKGNFMNQATQDVYNYTITYDSTSFLMKIVAFLSLNASDLSVSGCGFDDVDRIYLVAYGLGVTGDVIDAPEIEPGDSSKDELDEDSVKNETVTIKQRDDVSFPHRFDYPLTCGGDSCKYTVMWKVFADRIVIRIIVTISGRFGIIISRGRSLVKADIKIIEKNKCIDAHIDDDTTKTPIQDSQQDNTNITYIEINGTQICDLVITNTSDTENDVQPFSPNGFFFGFLTGGFMPPTGTELTPPVEVNLCPDTTDITPDDNTTLPTTPSMNSTAPSMNSTAPSMNSTAPSMNSTAPSMNSTAPQVTGTSTQAAVTGATGTNNQVTVIAATGTKAEISATTPSTNTSSSNVNASQGSTVSGVSEGSTVSGASEGSTVSGASQGSTASGASEGSTVSGASQDSTASGASEGSTVSGASQGSTVSGASEGSTVSGASEGSTVSGASQGSTVSGASQGSTVSGASQGSTVSGASEGSTISGASQGSTVSGASEGSTISGASQGSTVSGASQGPLSSPGTNPPNVPDFVSPPGCNPEDSSCKCVVYVEYVGRKMKLRVKQKKVPGSQIAPAIAIINKNKPNAMIDIILGIKKINGETKVTDCHRDSDTGTPVPDDEQNIENPSVTENENYTDMNVMVDTDSTDLNDCNADTEVCEIRAIPEGIPCVNDEPQKVDVPTDTVVEVIPKPDTSSTASPASPVSGASQGSTVSGASQGSTVSGASQGSTVSGASQGSTVSGESQGSTVSGASQGSTVSGASQGSTVSGASQGSTVSGASQGSTVSGVSQGSTVSGASQGSTVSGASQGSTVSGASQGSTVSGASQGSTVSGASQGSPASPETTSRTPRGQSGRTVAGKALGAALGTFGILMCLTLILCCFM